MLHRLIPVGAMWQIGIERCIKGHMGYFLHCRVLEILCSLPELCRVGQIQCVCFMQLASSAWRQGGGGIGDTDFKLMFSNKQ